jgi:hypothetical protein
VQALTTAEGAPTCPRPGSAPAKYGIRVGIERRQTSDDVIRTHRTMDGSPDSKVGAAGQAGVYASALLSTFFRYHSELAYHDPGDGLALGSASPHAGEWPGDAPPWLAQAGGPNFDVPPTPAVGCCTELPHPYRTKNCQAEDYRTP